MLNERPQSCRPNLILTQNPLHKPHQRFKRFRTPAQRPVARYGDMLHAVDRVVGYPHACILQPGVEGLRIARQNLAGADIEIGWREARDVALSGEASGSLASWPCR